MLQALARWWRWRGERQRLRRIVHTFLLSREYYITNRVFTEWRAHLRAVQERAQCAGILRTTHLLRRSLGGWAACVRRRKRLQAASEAVRGATLGRHWQRWRRALDMEFRAADVVQPLTSFSVCMLLCRFVPS